MCAECGGLETVVVGRGRRSRTRGRRRGAAVKAQGSEVSEGIFSVPAEKRSAGSSCQLERLRYPPERAHSRARGAPHRSKSARRGAEEGGEWGRTPRPPARWHNEGRGGRHHCAPPQAGRPGSERQSAGAAGQPQGFAPRKKPHPPWRAQDFFWGDAQHPCGFAAGTARETETSTMLTGVTAPPKGEERPYLPMTARIAFRGGSSERGLALLPGGKLAERTGAMPAAAVPGLLPLPLMEPPGGAGSGYPHLPRALRACGCPGLAPGGSGLQGPVPSGSHFPFSFCCCSGSERTRYVAASCYRSRIPWVFPGLLSAIIFSAAFRLQGFLLLSFFQAEGFHAFVCFDVSCKCLLHFGEFPGLFGVLFYGVLVLGLYPVPVVDEVTYQVAGRSPSGFGFQLLEHGGGLFV